MPASDAGDSRSLLICRGRGTLLRRNSFSLNGSEFNAWDIFITVSVARYTPYWEKLKNIQRETT